MYKVLIFIMLLIIISELQGIEKNTDCEGNKITEGKWKVYERNDY